MTRDYLVAVIRVLIRTGGEGREMFKKLFAGLKGGQAEVDVERSFEQRRKAARRPCAIDVEAVVGRKSYPVEVVDMSVGGLRLRSSSALPVKAKSAIRLVYHHPIPKHDVLVTETLVKWTKSRAADGTQFIGVEFKDPKALARSWVKAKMSDLGFQSYNLKEQRAQHRARTHIRADLDLVGTSVRAVVTDLGPGGCQFQVLHPVRAGATVTLSLHDYRFLPGDTYNVVVRHMQQSDPGDPFGYGCAFQGLSPAQVEALERFLVEQHEHNWERLDPWPDPLYSGLTAAAADDVEIPDLASILEGEDDEEEEER